MTTVVEFVVEADARRWRDVGFDVDDGTLQLGGIRLRFRDGSRGIVAWQLSGAPLDDVGDIDGLETTDGDPSASPSRQHPNSVVSIDHVVIYTDDLERTCSAIEAATAAPLKRVREAGTLRQGFHRLGELIVEVVTFPKIDVDGARFWGLALNAADLDAMFDRYGEDVVSPPKDAVQPGRRISSFRESAGLGLPVALMM